MSWWPEQGGEACSVLGESQDRAATDTYSFSEYIAKPLDLLYRSFRHSLLILQAASCQARRFAI